MDRSDATTCNETLLDRYLNRDVDPNQVSAVRDHLETCSRCRQHADLVTSFGKAVRDFSEHGIRSVDFAPLEKEVLTAVIRDSRLLGGDGFWTSTLARTLVTALSIGAALTLLAYLYLAGYLGP